VAVAMAQERQRLEALPASGATAHARHLRTERLESLVLAGAMAPVWHVRGQRLQTSEATGQFLQRWEMAGEMAPAQHLHCRRLGMSEVARAMATGLEGVAWRQHHRPRPQISEMVGAMVSAGHIHWQRQRMLEVAKVMATGRQEAAAWRPTLAHHHGWPSLQISEMVGAMVSAGHTHWQPQRMSEVARAMDTARQEAAGWRPTLAHHHVWPCLQISEMVGAMVSAGHTHWQPQRMSEVARAMDTARQEAAWAPTPARHLHW